MRVNPYIARPIEATPPKRDAVESSIRVTERESSQPSSQTEAAETFQSSAEFQSIEIVASPEVGVESLARLRATAGKAVSYFEEHFGQVTRPLRFRVGNASDALRTGYNYEQDVVALPNLKNVKNSGLDSDDIINHEIFHALMFGAYPEFCTPEAIKEGSSTRLHEGLADYFAHQLEPDDTFGEDYYIAEPHVRSYRNDLSINLSAGAHAQGNALTSHLLAHDVKSDQVRAYLDAGDFTLEAMKSLSPEFGAALDRDASFSVEPKASGYPSSKLGRFSLRKDLPLGLDLSPSASLAEAYPDFKVVWTDVKGLPSKQFVFEETSPHNFRVKRAPEADYEKMIARYTSGGKVIGFRPFYFGTRD